MANEFVIVELGRLDGPGEEFHWFADRKVDGIDSAGTTQEGGARAMPFAPWNMGGSMRNSRTDYTGNTSPTVQVLGPKHKPFSVRGKWDDRFNFEGYWLETRRRFETMCRRGNFVRISHGEDSFIGLITEWNFGKQKKTYYITYSFTFDVHDREEDFATQRRPDVQLSPQDMLNSVLAHYNAMDEADKLKPIGPIPQATLDDINSSFDDVAISVDQAEATISQRNAALSDSNLSQSPFKRMAARFTTINTYANTLTDQFDSLRSDLLLFRTAIDVLNYEDWVRSTCYSARLTMAAAQDAARDLHARDSPDAKRLHPAKEGENLYDISRRYYGTPFAWEEIYYRNNLSSFYLDGTETLIIPERGRG